MEDGRILIIEDEKKIADTLRFGLMENGYDADVAYEAESGEVMFEQGQYHIVLLDINLPGMNGFEFCQKIRAHNKNVVIIMLTSMSTISDKVKGYH
ncbi:MAG TPA: response regulator, partial [Chitinophagaceae bacterium]